MAQKRKDKFHISVIKEISKRKQMDFRVVDLVATHPLLFTVHVMRDGNDDRPIMHRYLGKFAILKRTKNKK